MIPEQKNRPVRLQRIVLKGRLKKIIFAFKDYQKNE